MSAVISRPVVEPYTRTCQAWERLVNDPALAEVIEKLETDQEGNLIVSPLPGIPHCLRQDRISQVLKRMLPEGGALESPVSTREGVKAPDAVRYRPGRADAGEARDASFTEFAPDLRIGALSPSNPARDLRKKKQAASAAGVREDWIRDRDDKMGFFDPQGPPRRSAPAPTSLGRFRRSSFVRNAIVPDPRRPQLRPPNYAHHRSAPTGPLRCCTPLYHRGVLSAG